MKINKKHLPQMWFFFDIFDNDSVLAFKNLSCKIGVIFFNKKKLNQQTFLNATLRLQSICKSRNQKFLIQFKTNFKHILGSQGAFIYLDDLKKNRLCITNNHQLRKKVLFSTSIHNEIDLKKACKYNFDLIFISPLSLTNTHPNLKPHSTVGFLKLCFKEKRIVFALGGVTNINFKRLKNKYLAGFGAINFFINNEH